MIQRIQTLYYLVTFLLLACMIFMPVAVFEVVSGAQTETLKMTAFGIKSYTADAVSVTVARTVYFGSLVVLACLLAVVVLFSYRKRLFQMRMSWVLLILELGLQIFTVYYLVKLAGVSQSGLSDVSAGAPVYSITAVFPVICMILTYMAYRGVVKDEALVRSLDRIR